MPNVNHRQIACYVTPEQAQALKDLSSHTRVPMQVYLREAVDDLLKKYAPKGAKGGSRGVR